MDDWIKVTTAAELLGITRAAVYRLIERGTLGSKLIGLVRMVRRSSVDALLADTGYLKRSRAARGQGRLPGLEDREEDHGA